MELTGKSGAPFALLFAKGVTLLTVSSIPDVRRHRVPPTLAIELKE